MESDLHPGALGEREEDSSSSELEDSLDGSDELMTRPVAGNSSDHYVLVRKASKSRSYTISRDYAGRPLIVPDSVLSASPMPPLLDPEDDVDDVDGVDGVDGVGGVDGGGGVGGSGETGGRMVDPMLEGVVDDGSAVTSEERILANAVRRFAKKPKNAFAYLEEKGYGLGGDPKRIASFLLTSRGISKRAVGDYLGGEGEEAERVVEAFCGMFDFGEKSILAALRAFLDTFRLPGEAQKIDRLMEPFASAYVGANPGLFANADTAYILSFALIMLQTDLHNPAIKTKMSKEAFASRLRGIDNGGDVDPQLLSALYDDIAAHPIAMDVEDPDAAVFADANKKGYLRKRGGRIPTWRRRYFVLIEHCLYYFKTEEDPAPKGFLPLESLSLRLSSVKPHAFEIYNPSSAKIKTGKMSGRKMEEGHHKSLLLAATSDEERDTWMDVIAKNMASSPFELLMESRKRATTVVVAPP